MIKKVIFVSLLDIISIPSGNEHPVDITDFQLKHDFFRALQADNNIIRVNILGYDKIATIKNRYGKDPLPELRNLWAKGLVKNCRTLNDLLKFRK